MKKETFNITIKCDSYEDREEVLDMISEGKIEKALDVESLYKRKIVRFGKGSNVFYSENDQVFANEQEREL
tara:strand:+ start:1337 stop:1549 length:213 start_codon:yes stop_codon:yes gene_type:complete